MGRKTLNKELRQNVYDKYGGRCAYCGCELDFENMEIDHIYSFSQGKKHNTTYINHPSNLLPSCTLCNNNKGNLSLEDFRHKIVETFMRISTSPKYQFCKKYGFFTDSLWDGKFYFEKYGKG